ncbi:MAG: phosphodiester glycosidase family protein [Oscillospiraceae bacterium]|nr:phosphodiester glycosidase family protein [Oscillospiraceae bacterium]
MKKIRSCLALFLVVTALLSLTFPALADSEALGTTVQRTDTAIHQNTQLSTNVFWSSYFSNFRTENFVTYKPNGDVKPIVTYGDALTDVSTMTRAANYLQNNGYRVVCGINGDFFNTKNGLPVGLVVTDGKLRTSDAGYYAIGFRADGSAILGKPSLKIHADFGYKIYEESGYGTQVVRDIAAINKARVSTGGIYLFTRDFSSSHTTGNTENGFDAICTVISGSLTIGGTVKMRVDEVRETAKATPIAANQIVLSVNRKSNEYWQKAFVNLPVGSTITLTVTAADERWNTVQQAMGALYLLAENGKIVNTTQTSKGPRTAVGQKPDGTLIFYTIDGRISGHSIGATLYQTAQRLLELGCSTVLGLDGGGSTTISVTMPDSTKAATINKPSEGTERAVTNKLFLVSDKKATGVLDHFYVVPDHAVVLAGSQVRLTVTGVDTAYFPMEAACNLSASAGTLNGQTLTTPKGGGKVTVTASAKQKTGSTVIEAVTTPDSITVRNAAGKAVETLQLSPGASAQLTASAAYKHLKLYAEAGAFNWSNATQYGKISDTGLYTAVKPGDDTITVTCGGRSVKIPVTVSKVPLKELEDFEETPSGTGNGAALVNVVGGEYPRYGRGAGEFHYDMSGQTPTVTEDNSTRMTAEELAELSGMIPEEGVPVSWEAVSDVYGEDIGALPPDFDDIIPSENGLPDDSGDILPSGSGSPDESGEIFLSGNDSPDESGEIFPSENGSPDDSGDILPSGNSTPDESGSVEVSSDIEQEEIWNPTSNSVYDETFQYGGLEWADDLQWADAFASGVDSDESLYGNAAASVPDGEIIDSGDIVPPADNNDTIPPADNGNTQAAPDNVKLLDGGGSVGVQWRYTRPLSAPGIPYESVSIWVKGDGSGNRFCLLCRDASGNETQIPVTALDFTDWRREFVPLGSTAYSIAGYAVNTPTGTADDQVFEETPRAGVIYLDQMVATYNGLVDTVPPSVKLSRKDNVITATVQDTMDGVLPRTSIRAAVNGVSVAGSYNTNTGVMTVTVPKATDVQEPTRVTVTARDASGNIGRASVDIAPYNVTNKFNDIEGCWAKDYINFLYNRKIAEPYADGAYHPYDIITRAEFAVMLARAMNLDGRTYADVQLPYADLDEIPASALPALKALYAENIMRGSTEADGKTYLKPNSGLTRAHAAAMIGRSQKLGYGSAELKFPDADSIPAYAVPHIRVMVARGILAGYADGYFRSGNNISRGQMAKILYFLA